MKEKFLLMLLAIALVAGAAQAEMLTNPSFEDGTWAIHGNPDHWVHLSTGYIPAHDWIDDSAGAHSGSKYMKMYNWYHVQTYWTGTSAYLGQTVDGVKEGKDYSFSVWAKNGAEGKTPLAAMEVEWRDSKDNWIDSDSIYIPVTDSDWIELDFGAFTAPDGAAAAILWLVAAVDNNELAICYDDVSMIGPDPNINSGPDMISWSGQTVSLTATTSLVESYSTITWSADPDYCAVITDGDTLTPTVQVNPIILATESAPIVNHSFENDLTGWTVIGDGGTWDGVVDSTTYITPTDGSMLGYANDAGAVAKLTQVLGNTLAANTTYTLTVDVANDGYYEEPVSYRVQFRAGTGGAPLSQDNNSHALDDYGVWETSTVTFATGATHAKLGEPLEIHLIALSGTTEMCFDNVRLTADPPFPAYVPDVLTYTMTIEIDGDKYDTMKIDAYPDACAAKLAAGLRETSDLVDEDCITDLADLDELLSTWTVDNALTEPLIGEVGAEAGTVLYDFDDGTMQGWSNYEDTTGGELYVIWTGSQYEPAHTGLNMVKEETWGDRDADLHVKVLVSPVFRIIPTSYVEVWTLGGIGNVETPSWTKYAELPTSSTEAGGFVGIALRRMSDGKYLLFDRRTDVGENFDAYEAIGWTVEEIAAAVEFDDPLEQYVVDVIDTHTTYGVSPWWAWIAVDTITLVGDFSVDPMDPSPIDGAYVPPTSDLELSWTNLDAVPDANDPVWVDVWFGMDPNDYNDYNKIVTQGENTTSKTVDASTLGTYYWQVNSYIHGDPCVVLYDIDGTDANRTVPVIEGTMWEFHAASDVPVSVIAGDSWITWSGQAVQLDAHVTDDGTSALTYVWSTDPTGIAVFDPNEFVEDPTVTVTSWFYSVASIANAGFEIPVIADGTWTATPDWSLVGGGWIWGVNPGDANSNYAAYGGIAPEGGNVGISGTSGEGGLGQVLNETLAADTTYELTVKVGNPPLYGWFGYKVQLLAGGTILEEDDSSLTIAADTFETSTVTYDSNDVDAGLLGQNLEIRLLAVSNGSNLEVNFDDVRLTASPPFPSPATVPQTATLTLSVHDDLNSDEDTMTIDVYDNACIAAIGEGIAVYDPGDFDQDCDTDLANFAVIAEEWLVYTELSTSIVKP